jgi:hypothetical protein
MERTAGEFPHRFVKSLILSTSVYLATSANPDGYSGLTNNDRERQVRGVDFRDLKFRV